MHAWPAGGQHAHQLAQDIEVLHEAFGTGTLEGELARRLQPAVALVAYKAALGMKASLNVTSFQS
jgi:hypothetical protein